MRRRMTRRGITLVEIMLVLIVAGIVTAAVSGVLRRQQRFYRGVGSLIAQRVALRDATGIIPGDIRALSPAAGDVLAFSDSSLEMRATIGAAIACDTVAGGGAITLAPGQLGGEVASTILSAFTTAPEPGDLVVVYDAAQREGTDDDRWWIATVSDVSSGTGLCDASPFAGTVGAGSASVRLHFASSDRAPPTVRPGAFVRVLRRVRYRFYRAATGDWHLGYSEWNGSSFDVVQPVTGPFAPYAERGGSGVSFRFFDGAGAVLPLGAVPSRIARVAITVRGASGPRLSGSDGPSDSQTVTIRSRNR